MAVEAANMRALRADIKAERPGATIYGIGDAAHQNAPSDHNADDTAGSNAAQSDADTRAEWRALDVMLTAAFTAADAAALVTALIGSSRLVYVIYDRTIWSASSGWAPRRYGGSDPHTNHVHISGRAGDDENASGWPAVREALGGEDPVTDEEFRTLMNNYFTWLRGGSGASSQAQRDARDAYRQALGVYVANSDVAAEIAEIPRTAPTPVVDITSLAAQLAPLLVDELDGLTVEQIETACANALGRTSLAVAPGPA